MTWLKLSDDFADECARAHLSSDAFRTHVEGLLWTMRRETSGQIDALDVRRFAESRHPDEDIAELVKAGFWTQTHDGWVIEHHMQHQIVPELVERRRQQTAERMRRKRLRDAGLPDDQPKVTRHKQRHDPRHYGTGRGGTGLETPDYVAPKKEERDWPSFPRCEVCSTPLDPTLAAAGETTHPTCGPG